MGVPAFFRWLTRKYPSVIVHCIEEKQQQVEGTDIPVDSSTPNPNGVEFDNLYLDMNGIIHPCTHPEDKPAPKNEDEMMIAIFECIDRLFRIVRPRKVLYMAIDGVAPRAKMNQQRSRRFRASKESVEKIKEIDRIREELMAKGCELPPPKPKEEHFDSNCITPGTPFMDRLSRCLHYYIHDRLNNDPGWKGIKVILSDANVPGEGEHKIMDYIRRQRAQPDHDPNTSHCLCGADADLIMLALATHEPNFTIIREEFKPNKPRPCEICNQVGHEMQECLGLEKEVPSDFDAVPAPCASEVEFIFVRINVLREYLEKELEMPNLPFKYELERAIDDWVFMCFFVGNDFLPHLPSLEIRENAIDRLVNLYKKTVYKTGGWLTDSGVPALNRVQLIMSDLGEVEDDIFRNRHKTDQRFKAQRKRRKMEQEGNSNCYNKPAYIPEGQFAPVEIGSTPSPVQNLKQEAYRMRVNGMQSSDGRSNRDAAMALKSMLMESPGSSSESGSNTASPAHPGYSSSPSPSPGQSPSIKRKGGDDSDDDAHDEVRLWEDGFKDRYYESKFDVDAENFEFRNEVARQYVQGLCWVLRYYYQGCASWKWYFPYHYAPFASDFINIGDLSTEFEKYTQPFKPLEQLMGVFPAASRSHVPEPWGVLMMDPDSPIIDFYPEDFQIDLNGKKFAWQGVALLPFVDEARLKDALIPYYDKLTAEEIRRNVRGDDRLYLRKGHTGYDFLTGLYENEFDANEETPLDPKLFDGANGFALVCDENIPFRGTLPSPIRGLLELEENQVVCIRYRDPKFEEGYIFPAVRLSNAVDPPKVLKPGDLPQDQSRNWRPMIGMAHSNKRASLDSSGHRMLSHEGYDRNSRSGGRGAYSNMPPPPHNPYVERQDHRGYQQHRSRPYDINNRRGGMNSYNRGGSSWNNSGRNDDRSRQRDYGHGGGSGYGQNSYSRGGGNSYQAGGGNSYQGGGRSHGGGYSSHSNQSYGYSTGSSDTSSSDYGSYNSQQGRYGSYGGGGGGSSSSGHNSYGYSSGSTSQSRGGDRNNQRNDRDAGRRQEGYYTAGYFTGSGDSSNSSGQSTSSNRRYQ